MRAGLGKANVDDPADLVRVGNRAACVAAVGHARLAARPSGVQHHHGFGERGGLPPGRPPQLLDLDGELIDAGPKPLVVPPSRSTSAASWSRVARAVTSSASTIVTRPPSAASSTLTPLPQGSLRTWVT